MVPRAHAIYWHCNEATWAYDPRDVIAVPLYCMWHSEPCYNYHKYLLECCSKEWPEIKAI